MCQNVFNYSVSGKLQGYGTLILGNKIADSGRITDLTQNWPSRAGVFWWSLIIQLHNLKVLSVILWIYLTSCCHASMQRLSLDLHLWGLLSPEVKTQDLPGNRWNKMIVLPRIIFPFIQVDRLPLLKVAPRNHFALTAAWKPCNLWSLHVQEHWEQHTERGWGWCKLYELCNSV